MPTMYWEPFRDLVKIRERMNKLLEEMTARAQGRRLVFGTWTPAVDIYEYKDRFVVHAELPGMTQKELSLQMEKDTLLLKGERKPSVRPRSESFHQIEIAYGSFRREFTLPKSVRVENVKATYTNGILTVELPKTEEHVPKRIRVKS